MQSFVGADLDTGDIYMVDPVYPTLVPACHYSLTLYKETPYRMMIKALALKSNCMTLCVPGSPARYNVVYINTTTSMASPYAISDVQNKTEKMFWTFSLKAVCRFCRCLLLHASNICHRRLLEKTKQLANIQLFASSYLADWHVHMLPVTRGPAARAICNF